MTGGDFGKKGESEMTERMKLLGNITRNCTRFRITLKSMGSKCDGQRKSLTVQLNSRPVRRTELVRFSCSGEDFCVDCVLRKEIH